MPLVQTTLENELNALGLYLDESEANTAWTNAFAEYLKGMSSNGIPVSPAAATAGKAAFLSALEERTEDDEGISTDLGGSLQAALIAYWGIVSGAIFPNPLIAWVSTPPVTGITIPSGLSTVKAELDPVLESNTTNGYPKPTCMANIAAAVHPLQIGPVPGTVAWPPPPTGAGTVNII